MTTSAGIRSTGPGMDQREGHVFVGNLLVADENFHQTAFAIRADESALRKTDET